MLSYLTLIKTGGEAYMPPCWFFFQITFRQKITLPWFTLTLSKNALRINLQKMEYSQ